MPAMRGRALALVVVAALALTACGGDDGVEKVAAPAPAPEPGGAKDADAAGKADDPEATDDYWSKERLASLEAAKRDYVAPTPAAPAGGEGASAADDPAPAETGSTTAGEAVMAGTERHRLEGFVDVPDHVWLRESSDEEPEEGDDCRRDQEGSEDVRPGGQLTVSDGDGKALAAGELEAGTLTTSYEEDVGRAMDCRLPFIVEDVPPADSYTIALEGHDEVTYAFEDLERQAWRVAFTIDW